MSWGLGVAIFLVLTFGPGLAALIRAEWLVRYLGGILEYYITYDTFCWLAIRVWPFSVILAIGFLLWRACV